MREGDGTTPKMVKWWHNDGAVIDFTNPHAVDWYTSRLRALQTNYGVDSFKFDAGEYMYTPPAPRTTFAPLNATMDFSRLYLSVAAEFAPLAEVRSGYDTQDLPIFVREFDKDSTWSTDNGLQALVTGALTFGVLGYPFVLPGAFVSQPRASCLLERTLSRGHHLMFGGWFLWHSLPFRHCRHGVCSCGGFVVCWCVVRVWQPGGLTCLVGHTSLADWRKRLLQPDWQLLWKLSFEGAVQSLGNGAWLQPVDRR